MNKEAGRMNKNYKKCPYCDFCNPKNVKRCIKCGKKFNGKKIISTCLFKNKISCKKINFSILFGYFKKLQKNPKYKPTPEENKEIVKIIFLIISIIIGFMIFMDIISSFN